MIVGAFEQTFPFRLVNSALPASATPAAPSVAPSVAPSAVLRNLKCGYPSKICTNERAWKRDGSLHRFCEEHRARANVNQKRWAQRKARTKAEKQGGDAAAAATAEEFSVDESMLQAKAPMDFSDFDMTLELLLKDASFWSPTAAASAGGRKAQWECEELAAQTFKEEDAMEAELWAALGLGNVTMSL